jgi:hypothetical protein
MKEELTIRYIQVETPQWKSSSHMHCLSLDIITPGFEVLDDSSVRCQLGCLCQFDIFSLR